MSNGQISKLSSKVEGNQIGKRIGKGISKGIGKRTYTLKELAERDFLATPVEALKDTAPIFNLVNIKEDLLDDCTSVARDQEVSPTIDSQKKIDLVSSEKTKVSSSSNSLPLSIELVNHLIAKEVALTSQQLDLEQDELQAWIDMQVMVPKQTLLVLLRLARTNRLDPLKEEVALALYDDTHWQAYITVEGCSKLLNRHEAFDGIVFAESPELVNGIPIWMECAIYRKDRSKPIVIREYFEEVKTEQIIWQKMPRRMLRHRVMQQCARLAVG